MQRFKKIKNVNINLLSALHQRLGSWNTLPQQFVAGKADSHKKANLQGKENMLITECEFRKRRRVYK